MQMLNEINPTNSREKRAEAYEETSEDSLSVPREVIEGSEGRSQARWSDREFTVGEIARKVKWVTSRRTDRGGQAAR